MASTILFRPHAGGLGDSLIYSTLPELWVRERRSDVYIVDCNFRNPGVPAIVWESNPFVSGIVKTPATHAIEYGSRLNALLLQYKNNIKAHEAFFGFEPAHAHPKIYWQPKYIRGLSAKVLLDPTGITLPYTKAAFEPFVRWLAEQGVTSGNDLMVLESSFNPSDSTIFPELPRVRADTIFDFASAIYSCALFMTNESGGAALASAIKGAAPYPKICAAMATRSFNTRTWVWSNIDYWITGSLTPDF